MKTATVHATFTENGEKKRSVAYAMFVSHNVDMNAVKALARAIDDSPDFTNVSLTIEREDETLDFREAPSPVTQPGVVEPQVEVTPKPEHLAARTWPDWQGPTAPQPRSETVVPHGGSDE